MSPLKPTPLEAIKAAEEAVDKLPGRTAHPEVREVYLAALRKHPQRTTETVKPS